MTGGGGHNLASSKSEAFSSIKDHSSGLKDRSISLGSGNKSSVHQTGVGKEPLPTSGQARMAKFETLVETLHGSGKRTELKVSDAAGEILTDWSKDLTRQSQIKERLQEEQNLERLARMSHGRDPNTLV